jgi:hypothetical protein
MKSQEVHARRHMCILTVSVSAFERGFESDYPSASGIYVLAVRNLPYVWLRRAREQRRQLGSADARPPCAADLRSS